MAHMPWTRLQKALADRLAPSMRAHIAIHQARYRNTGEEAGRVWLTLDGRELISFDTSRYVARRAQIVNEMRAGVGPFGLSATSDYGEFLDKDRAAVEWLRRAGEYDDYCAIADLEAYLSMSIDEALASPAPLLRALAMADRRLGKRRLKSLSLPSTEHPTVRHMLHARCQAEGIDRSTGAV